MTSPLQMQNINFRHKMAFKATSQLHTVASSSHRFCCKAQDECASKRRAVMLTFLSTPLIASSARALIPDDDDEELVDLAKSRRKERLASEKTIEKNFISAADYSGLEVSRVQNAVNRLAKEGLSLASGDIKSLAGSASESWVGELQKAVKDLSGNSAAQSSSSEVLSVLTKLGNSFKSGDLEQAKYNFAKTVDALQTWISDAGLSNQIKGL